MGRVVKIATFVKDVIKGIGIGCLIFIVIILASDLIDDILHIPH